MLKWLQYDPRKRPTASELLSHPYFMKNDISREIYNHVKGKNLSKINATKGQSEKRLVIQPNKIQLVSGIKSGFDYRKPKEKPLQQLERVPSLDEINRAKENLRQYNKINEGLIQQSMLAKRAEDLKQEYYLTEDRKSDPEAYIARLKDPIYPYYQQSNNNIFDTYK